ELARLGIAEPGRVLVERQAGGALALQHLLHALAAERDVPLGVARVEPLSHLGPRPVARDEAELRVEPVARRAVVVRPTLLRGDDLDRLAVLQPRRERDHDAIDPCPPATVP